MWMLSGHCPHYNITLLSECMIEIQCVHTMSLQCAMFTCTLQAQLHNCRHNCRHNHNCQPTHWAASMRWGISFIISTHGRWAVITYTNRKVKGKCANDMMPSYPPKQQDRENELTVYMTSWNMTQKVLLVPIFYIVAERKNTKLRECFLVKWSALLWQSNLPHHSPRAQSIKEFPTEILICNRNQWWLEFFLVCCHI